MLADAHLKSSGVGCSVGNGYYLGVIYYKGKYTKLANSSDV